MKGKISLIFLTFLCIVACKSDPLRKGDWNKDAYNALNAMLEESDTYAVFDFDNTVVVEDISVTTMIYQIENLKYKFDPEIFWDILTGCVPDVDAPLSGFSATSTRMLATDLFNDYEYLYSNFIHGDASLDDIHETDEYKDFRAKLYAISEGVSNTFDYGTGCLWITGLFKGMSRQELQNLVREAADEGLSKKKIKMEKWTSPDMGEAGVISVSFPKGFGITPEMKNLFSVMAEKDIDIYICSASMESIVEAIACDEKYGLNVPEANVFGIRTAWGYAGMVYDPTYAQPILDGKVENIKRYMAPSHDGAMPYLVAGDSSGDLAMLRECAGHTGLIINHGNAKKLLEELGEGNYVVQGVNDKKKSFTGSAKGKSVK